MMNSLIRQFEDLFFQHEQGALRDEAWEGWLFSIRQTVKRPGFLSFWATRRRAFSASFIKLIDGEIEKVKAPNTSTDIAFLAPTENGD